MATQFIYCSKCREANNHYIATGRVAPEIFRRVIVVGRNTNGSYQCRCDCGHTWSSKSKEAAELYKQVTGNV